MCEGMSSHTLTLVAIRSSNTNNNLLWRTQIDNICPRQLTIFGKESIFRSTRHVYNILVLHCLGVLLARLSQHDGCINVDGIGGILDGSNHGRTKQLLQAHNVALGAVTDKDLVGINEPLVERKDCLFSLQGAH